MSNNPRFVNPEIGSLYRQSTGYPKPKQPGGVGTLVTAPQQPDTIYSNPPYTPVTNPTPYNERAAMFFPNCGHAIREWEIIQESALQAIDNQQESTTNLTGWAPLGPIINPVLHPFL